MKIKVTKTALEKVLALLLAGAGAVACPALENEGKTVLPGETAGARPSDLRYEESSASLFDKAVCVPVPDGLVRIKEGDPAIESFRQANYNEALKLLSCYVPREQLAKADVGDGLKTYAFLSESVSIGSRPISAREFKELVMGVKTGMPKFGEDLTYDITNESLTPELKALIDAGEIDAGDYRCWIKKEGEHEGNWEYRIANGKYETLKYHEKTVEEASIVVTSFLSVNSRFLVLKMVRKVEKVKDADVALKMISDDISAWVDSLRKETSEKCVVVPAPEEDTASKTPETSEQIEASKSSYPEDELKCGLSGQLLMCFLILLASIVAARVGRRSGGCQHDLVVDVPSTACDGPVGIAGWNLIPMLNLLATVAISLYQLVTVFWPSIAMGTMQNVIPGLGNGAISTSVGALVLLEAMSKAVFAVLSVRILSLAFSRSRLYPRMCTLFFWMVALFSLLDTLAGCGLGIACEPGEISSLLRGFGFALIWGCYFRKSKRVRNTFVR